MPRSLTGPFCKIHLTEWSAVLFRSVPVPDAFCVAKRSGHLHFNVFVFSPFLVRRIKNLLFATKKNTLEKFLFTSHFSLFAGWYGWCDDGWDHHCCFKSKEPADMTCTEPEECHYVCCSWPYKPNGLQCCNSEESPKKPHKSSKNRLVQEESRIMRKNNTKVAQVRLPKLPSTTLTRAC